MPAFRDTVTRATSSPPFRIASKQASGSSSRSRGASATAATPHSPNHRPRSTSARPVSRANRSRSAREQALTGIPCAASTTRRRSAACASAASGGISTRTSRAAGGMTHAPSTSGMRTSATRRYVVDAPCRCRRTSSATMARPRMSVDVATASNSWSVTSAPDARARAIASTSLLCIFIPVVSPPCVP